MVHDGEYFRRRAAEARAAAFRRDEGEDADIAGQLALAYSALARRQAKPEVEVEPVMPAPIEG
jgi:predicted aminopeptidase